MSSCAVPENKWVCRWKYLVSAKPLRRGIWELKDGGFLLRVRTIDLKGKVHQKVKVLRDVSLLEAEQLRHRLLTDAPAPANEKNALPPLWIEFAASLLQTKVDEGRIRSAKGRETWTSTLARLAPMIGGIYVDEMTPAVLMEWRDTVAAWRREGMPPMRKRDLKKKRVNLSAATANKWISILKVVCAEMTVRFELPRDPAAHLQPFPRERTYTREQPNKLTGAEVPVFLAKLKEMFPQHYAMVVLGFAIGARPSSLRPLRRRGPTRDIIWPTDPAMEGRVLIRRSHTRRDEIMDQTKTGVDLNIPVPAPVIAVLREHVASLDGMMEDSDLLFPATTGRLRSASALDKPFRAVVAALGWPLHLTPRAMRRTFQDLTRRAQVPDVVTRAISGHATAEMQVHYSTAEDEEILAAVTDVASVLLATKRTVAVPVTREVLH